MELQPDDSPQSDSKRAIFAMMLIMGMMLVWGYMFAPKPVEQPPQDAEQPPAATQPTTAAPAATTPQPPTLRPATSTAATPAPKPTTAVSPTTAAPAATPSVKPTTPPPLPDKQPPPITIVKKSKLLAAEFSNLDGALARLVLLDYFRTPAEKQAARKARKQDPNADVTAHGLSLLGQVGSQPSLVILDPTEPSGAKHKDKEPAATPQMFAPRRFELVSQDERRVVFRSVFGQGRLELTKTFELPAPDDALQRHVAVAVQLKNIGTTPITLPGYRLRGGGGLAVDQGPKSWSKPEPTEQERKTATTYMTSAVATENESGDVNVERRTCAKLQKADLVRSEGMVLWAAAESNYFAAILEPIRQQGGPNWVRSGGAESVEESGVKANIQTASIALAPGKAVVHNYRLFAGPKTPQALTAYGYDALPETGWLDPLVDIMGGILRGAYWCVPNYGIAIIFLTLVVRGCLHPLSKKSQTSMQKMQKLQPQMQEVRDKYKGDKRRQQEELMKLHREYGVNPLGGCLPMILQIPIFIGLWRSLRGSIELRHAPFVFWIKDLSQPDYFMNTVNILPLISIAIMFIQQRMMPKSLDPQQQQTQKIMGYMMPAFLGFVLYNLPSGLALYFIASTCLGLVEQRLIKRHMDKMGDLKPIAKKPGKPGKPAGKLAPKAVRKRKAF